MGIWANDAITIIAKDGDGNVISQKVINGHNQYVDSFINGEGIKSLDFDVNVDEEMLVCICIDI